MQSLLLRCAVVSFSFEGGRRREEGGGGGREGEGGERGLKCVQYLQEEGEEQEER